MIEHCIPVEYDWGNVYVGCRSEHLDLFTEALPEECCVIGIDHSVGQADTVLQVAKTIGNPSEDFVVINSDNGFEYADQLVESFTSWCRASDAAVGAVVFELKVNSDSRKYGYVDGFPKFFAGSETTVLSPYALAGMFYVNRVGTLSCAMFETCKRASKVEELFMSSMFRYVYGPRLAYRIHREDLHEWGTPDKLESDTDVYQIAWDQGEQE
jgi:hypothetical protein